MLVLILTAAASAGAIGAWMLDRRRSRGRNERGECGACGTTWAETGTENPYLIHGLLVCEACAAKARRRMPWELAALAGWAGLVAAVAAGNALAGNGVAMLAFSIAGSALVVPLGAVQLMKLANRNAQRRIVAGEFPGFNALDTETRTGADAVLTEGPEV